MKFRYLHFPIYPVCGIIIDKKSMLKGTFGGDNISALNKQFVLNCRARGRLTIDDAVEIAEEMGLFENEDPEIIMLRDKKQQVRLLLSRVTSDNERVIRSIRLGDESFYVDLANSANRLELNLLIKIEEAKIRRSQKIVDSLRKISNRRKKDRPIDGQLNLDEFFQDAL